MSVMYIDKPCIMQMVAHLIKTLMVSTEDIDGVGKETDKEEEQPELDTESKDYQRIAGEMNIINENEKQALNQLAQATGWSILACIACVIRS